MSFVEDCEQLWLYLRMLIIYIATSRAHTFARKENRLPVINFREMPLYNWIAQFWGEKRWHPAHAARSSRRPRILGLAWTRVFIGGSSRGSNSLTCATTTSCPLDNFAIYCRCSNTRYTSYTVHTRQIHSYVSSFINFMILGMSPRLQYYINE